MQPWAKRVHTNPNTKKKDIYNIHTIWRTYKWKRSKCDFSTNSIIGMYWIGERQRWRKRKRLWLREEREKVKVLMRPAWNTLNNKFAFPGGHLNVCIHASRHAHTQIQINTFILYYIYYIIVSNIVVHRIPIILWREQTIENVSIEHSMELMPICAFLSYTRSCCFCFLPSFAVYKMDEHIDTNTKNVGAASYKKEINK